LAGLPPLLRLALDAQRAGAAAIVLADPTLAADSLSDPRLRVPLLREAPAGLRLIEVSGNLVVHREAFTAALATSAEARLRLDESTPAPKLAYAFSPVRVEDEPSARRAEAALFRSLRKAQDGWTSRYLNRYLSLSLSRLLVKTPLRPNQISVVILGIGLLGAWLATRGTWATLALGALLFQAQSVLDGCDGEVSRITHRGSLLGEWLDTVGDDLTNYAFFAGAAWGLHRAGGPLASVYLGAGLLTIVAGLIGSGLEYRYLIRIGSGDLLKYPLSASVTEAKGLGRLMPLFKRDTFVLLTFVAALGGVVGPMLVAFSLGAVGVLISVLRVERRLALQRRQEKAAA